MANKGLPSSLALIPDGNRRWARKNRLSLQNGYSLGVKKFIDFSEWCLDYGINNLSVWAFSTENISRSSLERNTLFNLYRKAAKDRSIISRLHKNETRLEIMGNKSLLPKDLVVQLHKIEADTAQYKDRVINLLLGYGGRDDIIHAAKELVSEAITKKIKSVNESMFRNLLFSAQMPDIDMLIRTSGEQRISGFAPWQLNYAELYFSDKLWPDFTRRDLDIAIEDYRARQRRFGK